MTPNQQRALSALLTSKNKTEAATRAGITPRSLTAYLSDPDFKKAYRQATEQAIEDAMRKAQNSLSDAVLTLREIMLDSEENSHARIAACRAVLEYGCRLTETYDILQRLEVLEDAAEKKH